METGRRLFFFNDFHLTVNKTYFSPTTFYRLISENLDILFAIAVYLMLLYEQNILFLNLKNC